jgi:hypothetical protein
MALALSVITGVSITGVSVIAGPAYAHDTPRAAPGAVSVSTTLVNASGDVTISDGAFVALGTSVFDSATVTPTSGSTTPTGTLTYNFFDNATCANSPASTQKVTLSGGGAVPDTAPTGALGAGNFAFDASYSGDTNYAGTTSGCEPFGVDQGTAGISTSLKTASGGVTIEDGWAVAAGTSVYGTAVLSPSPDPFTPTGAVTYTLFDDTSCSGSPGSSDEVTLNGDGTVPDGAVTGALSPGTYSFDASYSGDTNYGGSTSACESFSAFQVGADPPSEYYVAPPPFGSDLGNTCTLKKEPCATIAHAIFEEANLTPDSTGTVISLAGGTYNESGDVMFAELSPGNDDVTITGVGKKTAIYPQNCAALDTTTGGEDEGASAIVNFQGLTGVTIEKLNLIGGSIAGGVCPGYEAAVLGPRSAGGTQNAVVNTFISGGAPYGILMNNNASITAISNTLEPVLCTATVKGPNTGLNAGWGFNANLKVSKIPKCAQFIESGHGAFTGVFINGVAYTATASALAKTIVLTGYTGVPLPSTPEVPVGATVIFNTSAAPFTQDGIACNSPTEVTDLTTNCAISDNTVIAGGTVYSNHPAGIIVTGGATADLDGNTVSGVTDLAGDGVGIALVPDSYDEVSAGDTVVGVNETAQTGKGNTLSGNDIGIDVVGTPFGTPFDYAINGNTVSSANDVGVAISDVQVPGWNAVITSFETNTIEGAPMGEGLVLSGVSGQTIGGPSTALGNTISGNGIGLVLAPCTAATLAQCATGIATSGNTIEYNTITANDDFGVLTVGQFQPEELAAPTQPTLTSGGNTFDANTWTGNGTVATAVHGSEVLDGTGWGGGCAQAPACTEESTLYLSSIGATHAPTMSFGPTFPGAGTVQLNLCNAGSSAESLPAGSQITFDPAGDVGTFFVTTDVILPANGKPCTPSSPAKPVIVQAVAPAEVGTPSPTGIQPFIVAAGDTVTVDANGANTAAVNVYGTGPTANTCTPSGLNTVPNAFGTTNSAANPSSTTLDAGTGGVNATYNAC